MHWFLKNIQRIDIYNFSNNFIDSLNLDLYFDLENFSNPDNIYDNILYYYDKSTHYE